MTPVPESPTSGLHRGLNLLLAGFLVNSDHLQRLGGIDGTNLVGGLHAFAADNQVILAAQLATHFLNSGAHLPHILFFAEIDKRLILERALMQANLQVWRSFHSCHRNSFRGRNIDVSADTLDF